MNNVITVDAKTIGTILSRLDKLARDMEVIKERLLQEEPEYGSDAWWEWSDKKALEDIRAGKYTEISTVKELQIHLDSLKRK